MDQRKLHEPIKKWLGAHGVRVMPESENFPVPIKDVFPTQDFIKPDIIGIREAGEVVVVEAETNPEKMLEVMGKCMLWKTTAAYVYLAYPKDKCRKFKVLEKFGIGLLSVSEDSVDEIVSMFPTGDYDRCKATILTPIDGGKQVALYDQIKRIIEA